MPAHVIYRRGYLVVRTLPLSAVDGGIGAVLGAPRGVLACRTTVAGAANALREAADASENRADGFRRRWAKDVCRAE